MIYAIFEDGSRQYMVDQGDVVEQDPYEQNIRAHLNLGHTFAHALETLTGYERYLHGEAVAVGMHAAGRLSQSLGLRFEVDGVGREMWSGWSVLVKGRAVELDIHDLERLARLDRHRRACPHDRRSLARGRLRPTVRESRRRRK